MAFHQLRGLGDDAETDLTDEEADDAAEQQAANEATARITDAIDKLTAAIVAQKEPVVNVTHEKPKVTVLTAKKWEFTITRNAAGQIASITAESK